MPDLIGDRSWPIVYHHQDPHGRAHSGDSDVIITNPSHMLQHQRVLATTCYARPAIRGLQLKVAAISQLMRALIEVARGS